MSTAASHPPPLPERPPRLKPARPKTLDTPLLPPLPLTERPWGYVRNVWWSLEFGWGVGISAVLHVLLVIVLSLLVFRHQGTFGWFVQGSLGAERAEEGLDVPLDTRLEMESPAKPFEFVVLAESEGLEAVLEGASERIQESLEETGDKDSNLGDFAQKVAVPASAITKGSFTVWTDPEVPLPRHAYEIVIQVRLPPHVKSYRLRDLTGTVRGTDRYFKAIHFKPNERRTVSEGVVQVRIGIPGAEELVRDTIHVRSAILKEEQTIEIVFRHRPQSTESP